MISELELDIQYRPGQKHLHADALSRAPMEKRTDEPEFEPDVMQVTADPAVQHDKEVELGTEFVKLQREDPRLQELRGYLLILERERFTILDDVLYYVDPSPQHRLRVAVPESLRTKVMEENHSGPFGGHFAARRLLKTLTQRWRRISVSQSCLTCATYQGCGRRSKPLMQPIPVGAPFECMAVDIMEMPMTLLCGCFYGVCD